MSAQRVPSLGEAPLGWAATASSMILNLNEVPSSVRPGVVAWSDGTAFGVRQRDGDRGPCFPGEDAPHPLLGCMTQARWAWKATL